jgi:CRISPR-associated protein Cmr6
MEPRNRAWQSAKRDPTTHAGLWLDKALSSQREPGENDAQEAQGEAIRRLIVEAGGLHVPAGYELARKRRRALLDGYDGGFAGGVTRWFEARALGRLVIGIGTQSVRETALTLHHTWGVPILPGSALKGLASAAAHKLVEDPAWRMGQVDEYGRRTGQGDSHRTLFGAQENEGCVIFHDAWWRPEGDRLPIDLDIMTVHHREYYAGQGAPPTDLDEPNPVPLATTRGTFDVALTGPPEWVEAAASLLELGLQELGIGAKTRAGYGRMSWKRQKTSAEIDAEERERRAAKWREEARAASQGYKDGTWQQTIRRLAELKSAGVPLELLRAETRTVFKDKKKWKERLARCSPEEAALVEELFAAPASVPAEPAPVVPVAAAQAATAPAQVWERLVAWVSRDRKNRPIVCYRRGDALGERAAKDVQHPEVAEDLARATEQAPFPCEGLFEGQKLRALRRLPEG